MMLELKNIFKTYVQGKLDVPVLKNVSLAVEEGEYVAIMGPSGSGKTTLMNIIGCLDVPTSGAYLLEGTDISQYSDLKLSDVRLHSIGFVFQSFYLLSRESAIDNVALPLLYAGVRRKERLEIAKQALERVELGDRAEFKPTQLSGGQCQRVAIARAIVNNPKILLADEPTGALDTKSGEQIMEIFQRLNDEGVTIIMITHEPDIAAHAKRTLHIRDGRLMDADGNFLSPEEPEEAPLEMPDDFIPTEEFSATRDVPPAAQEDSPPPAAAKRTDSPVDYDALDLPPQPKKTVIPVPDVALVPAEKEGPSVAAAANDASAPQAEPTPAEEPVENDDILERQTFLDKEISVLLDGDIFAAKDDSANREFSIEEALAEEALTEEVPIEEALTEEAPTEETLTEEAPTEEVSTEEAPIVEAPTEDASRIDETPSGEQASDQGGWSPAEILMPEDESQLAFDIFAPQEASPAAPGEEMAEQNTSAQVDVEPEGNGPVFEPEEENPVPSSIDLGANPFAPSGPHHKEPPMEGAIPGSESAAEFEENPQREGGFGAPISLDLSEIGENPFAQIAPEEEEGGFRSPIKIELDAFGKSRRDSSSPSDTDRKEER